MQRSGGEQNLIGFHQYSTPAAPAWGCVCDDTDDSFQVFQGAEVNQSWKRKQPGLLPLEICLEL